MKNQKKEIKIPKKPVVLGFWPAFILTTSGAIGLISLFTVGLEILSALSFGITLSTALYVYFTKRTSN